MKPYYASPDGAITVYHARWEDVVAAGLVPVREVALVHADFPYGIRTDTAQLPEGKRRVQKPGCASTLSGGGRGRSYPPIVGDDKPANPSPLLALDRPSIFWGANHYADKLPASPSWILWDKREGQGSDDNADGELAWTNLGGALRIFRHWWRGALRKTEKGDRHLHPTQKPVALMSWEFRERAKLADGSLIFVPFGGSMPEIAVPGFRYIVCEVEAEYCRVAVGARLHAAPVADAPGPLFAGVR